MFKIEYVYVPLSGNAYVTMDICDSFDITKLNDREMRIDFHSSAYNLQNERIRITSYVIIPIQKLTPIKFDAGELKLEELHAR